MLADRRKISIRQATFLFLTIAFTPSIRIIPVYTAERAKQAAWLAPSVGAVMLILLSFIWQAFYRKFKDHSLMDIYSDIMGSFTGKILAVIQLIWMVLLTALYVRYFGIRLIGSIYPNMSISIFLVSMLIVIVYTLRYGLATLARLNEIVLPILGGVFYILVILMIPSFKSKLLTPITYRSILPVLNANIGIMGIMAYFTFLFIFGDKINNKEKIKRMGISASLFLLIALTAIIAITLGAFSYSVVQRTQLPFLTAVKQISLFNTLERIESVVVATWVISDFVLISFFTICTMRTLKSLFKLSDTKPFISIYMIFIYLLSMFLANSVFEMEKLSEIFFIPGNIALGFVLPAVVFFIGKIRKKI